MPGLYDRIKTWISGETLTASDLNAEFDNIKTNFVPNMIDDLSPNLAAMQTVSDPGGEGAETLPVDLREEVRQLRYQMKAIMATSQWYSRPPATLSGLNESFNRFFQTQATPAYIFSGLVDANRMPKFLTCDGTTLSLTLSASGTPFIYKINDEEYTVSSDKSITLAAGPTSNHLADADQTNSFLSTLGTYFSRSLGEDNMPLFLDSATFPANFTLARYKMNAFKTTNSSTEYFIGFLELMGGTDNYITSAYRGFLFNSSGVATRVAIADGQDIQLLKLHWIFIDETGTLKATANQPFVQGSTPSTGVAGDIWYDTVNNTWKLHNGTTFSTVNYCIIGLAATDGTAVVATRSFDFTKNYSEENQLDFMNRSGGTENFFNANALISVYGETKSFHYGNLDLLASGTPTGDDNVSDAPGSIYYVYLTDYFEIKYSHVKPHNRGGDLKGWYHPWKPWRCVATSETSGVNSRNMPLTQKGMITTMNLAPYTENNQGPNQYKRLLSGEGISGSGATSAVMITTYGRPVFLATHPNVGQSLSARFNSAAGNFKWQKRYLNALGVAYSSWTDISGPIVFDTGTGGHNVSLPPFIFMFDFPPAGVWEYRLSANVSSGTLACDMPIIAIEL